MIESIGRFVWHVGLGLYWITVGVSACVAYVFALAIISAVLTGIYAVARDVWRILRDGK